MSKQDILLEIIDDQIKVTSPYNVGFVNKCRNFRGKFKDNAWWFDDSILDYVREAMIEFYGTTGEEAYENCTLLVKNFSDEIKHSSVVLFGRTVAKAFGRDSGARLGDDIILIDGECTSGGSVKNWTTWVKNATFEIHNFPLPGTELPDVKKAIEEGWCTIKRKPAKTSIKTLEWNSPEVYSVIGPYAMDRKVIRDVDNPITTNDKMTWYLKYIGNELNGFCSVEYSKTSMAIKNFYSPVANDNLKFVFIDHIKKIFNESDVSKLYCFFKTSQLARAKENGFKEIKPGKNWHRLIIEK